MKTVEEMWQFCFDEAARHARVNELIARGISPSLHQFLFFDTGRYAMLERVEAMTPAQIVELNEAAA